MAWFERLIDLMPDSPESVGVCLSVAGWFGSMVGLLLHDAPLWIAAFLLFAAGAGGPGLHARKKRRNAPQAAATGAVEEDAAVDALIRDMEAERKIRASLGHPYQPGRDRLH